MLFSFQCPTCKGKLEADSSLSGAQAACPECGNLVAVPESRVDIGSTLAGFRLEQRLGKGGMGEVFLARQLSVDRQVAVKVLPPSFAEDEQAVQRFLHEGKLAARLDHANIVTVHEAGEDNGNYYLAMAYVEGESLDRRLQRDGMLPEHEALAIVRVVADALGYAWDDFRLLHRDIKPANIMIDRRGRIFLMDLGLAKSLGEDHSLTMSGSILGTPQYMSPEQAQSLSNLGVPSDVYSLGATLYHLVAGTPPFTGDSVFHILNQHVNTPLPPPRKYSPELSEGCCRLLDTMMAKKPADRYGDWHALVADIDRVLAGNAPLTPAGKGAPSSPVAAPQSEAPPTEPPPRIPPKSPPKPPVPPRRRRKIPTRLIAAAFGVPFLLLLLAAILRDRGTPATESPPETAGEAIVSAAPEQPDPALPATNHPLPGQAWTVPDLGMQFVWIEALDIWVGKYEVTNAEYRVKEPSHDSKEFSGFSLNGDRQPVVFVDWGDAVAYANWLNLRERAARRLPPGLRYRLPTEEEFTTFVQCGDGRVYPWGNSWPPPSGQAGNYSGQESAWRGKFRDYRDDHPVTCAVELSGGNPWGLFGVGGNVWEGCALDTSPEPQFGGWRGGCWGAGSQEFVRCERNFGKGSLFRSQFIGFRLVLAPGPLRRRPTLRPAPNQSPGS